MPGWSDGEGGGRIHEALGRLLGDGHGPADLLCFASAGNTARRHWAGDFEDDGSGWHQWAPQNRDNLLTPWGDDRVCLALCWAGTARYRLSVWDMSADREEAAAAPLSAGCAIVRFRPDPDRDYAVRVQRTDGVPGRFHLMAMSADLARATAAGSIAFPADGRRVLAVGAVDAEGRRASYSSCGPNSDRPKPDLVAPVPFPSQWRPQPFTGTSAAAPQAAALAALWWARHPEWTAQQVWEALRQHARDLGPPGHDWETGHGQIGLPLELLPTANVQVAPDTAAAAVPGKAG
jgi:subtilisin family serine protease